ncbi:MAG TPA: LytTR family DNA-binding domain-containing protein [Caproicibacter sp.]|nr:LytTR family DNA-binding domain-containing protein [Caproicibacter sp.]
MNIKVEIDDRYREPEMILRTDKMTERLEKLMDSIQSLTGETVKTLVGFKDGEAFLLKLEDVSTVFTESGRVCARSGNDEYTLKSRLYELEETLAGTDFLRVSNSEIVNFSKVKSLDLSRTGTIMLKFKTGETTFVSRRYVEKIKQYFKL